VDSLRSGGPPAAQRDGPAPSTEPDRVRTIPPLSTQQEIQQIGNQWAVLFAAGNGGSCTFMGQPLCERMACERLGRPHKIKNCTPPTRGYRRSFEGVFVSDVAFRGDRAAALLSNGEVIELCCDPGGWLVAEIGGSAGQGFWVAREATTDNRE